MLGKVPFKAFLPSFYADSQVNHLFRAAMQTSSSYLNTHGVHC